MSSHVVVKGSTLFFFFPLHGRIFGLNLGENTSEEGEKEKKKKKLPEISTNLRWAPLSLKV